MLNLRLVVIIIGAAILGSRFFTHVQLVAFFIELSSRAQRLPPGASTPIRQRVVRLWRRKCVTLGDDSGGGFDRLWFLSELDREVVGVIHAVDAVLLHLGDVVKKVGLKRYRVFPINRVHRNLCIPLANVIVGSEHLLILFLKNTIQLLGPLRRQHGAEVFVILLTLLVNSAEAYVTLATTRHPLANIGG